MKQLFKEKKGSAIITVLIVMGVLTLLGTAILQYSVNDNLQVFNDEKRMQAHYLARSGAEAVADYIINHPYEVDELVGKAAKPVEPDEETLQATLKGTFDVVVTKSGDGYLITSTGYVDGFERTVKLTMLPYGQGYGLGEFAVFCNSGIDLKQNTTIVGNVGTNATEKGSITCNGKYTINGDVLVGPGGDPDDVIAGDHTINGETGQLDSEIKYQVPEFPAFPDLDDKGSIELGNEGSDIISNDGYYQKIELGNGSKLTIDVGSDVRNVVVENLIVEGDIEIKGDGCLNLYVTDLEPINGNINIDGNVNALMMYYTGNKITMKKEIEFCGTIFAQGDLTMYE